MRKQKHNIAPRNAAEAAFLTDALTLYSMLNDDERAALLLQIRAMSWVLEAKC